MRLCGGRVSKQLFKLDVLSVNKILTRLQFACTRAKPTYDLNYKIKTNFVVKHHIIIIAFRRDKLKYKNKIQ